jgi:hypothetical protein
VGGCGLRNQKQHRACKCVATPDVHLSLIQSPITMKFASSAVQEAAAKPPPDPGDNASNATSSPWQKVRRGKAFPTTKPTTWPNTHFIRMVIPQESTLSTEQEFKDKSFSLLADLHGHLENWMKALSFTSETCGSKAVLLRHERLLCL